MQINDKTILITGANSGIGFQLAQQLIERGNRVIAVSRSQNNWPQLQALGDKIQLQQCNLSEKTEVMRLAEQLRHDKVALDIIINGAAIQLTPTLIDPDFSFSGIETEITTNFTAIVWLSYLLLPVLQTRPQSMIVNLSSGLAIHPKIGSAVYCASKAALHSFSQALRFQLEQTSVHVCEILLPLVDTPMTHGRGSNKLSPETAARAIIKAIEQNKTEAYIGKAKLLPPLMRLWPGLVRRILKAQ